MDKTIQKLSKYASIQKSPVVKPRYNAGDTKLKRKLNMQQLHQELQQVYPQFDLNDMTGGRFHSTE